MSGRLLSPEQLEELRTFYENRRPNGTEVLFDHIDALTEQVSEARKYYGPAGLRAVSSFIDEATALREQVSQLTVERDDCQKTLEALIREAPNAVRERDRLAERVKRLRDALTSILEGWTGGCDKAEYALAEDDKLAQEEKKK